MQLRPGPDRDSSADWIGAFQLYCVPVSAIWCLADAPGPNTVIILEKELFLHDLEVFPWLCSK